MNNIDETLAERGARYGDFTDHAEVAQALQDVMRAMPNWRDGKLSAVQRQALTVIADKIARIGTGDPEYDDNWHDIQGYAKLAEDRCAVKPAKAPGDGWIEWGGGKCPVSKGTKGSIRLRNSREYPGLLLPVCAWSHVGDDSDIVAYKVDS